MMASFVQLKKNNTALKRNSSFFSPAFIQPKLTIGQPNDKYEQEADAMADKVMRMPQNGPGIQTKCADCEQEEQVQPKRKTNFLSLKPLLQKMHGEEEELQTKPMLQRMDSQEEETLQTKPLMMKSEGGGGVATSALSSQLNSSKGSGSPLPALTNQFMSSAFGSDFSNVRVHTGSRAVQMNQSLGARAFTRGSDVYFNKGEYNPESSTGKRLLAHELTHVVQQEEKKHNTVQRQGHGGEPSLPAPTGTLTLRLNERGRVEIIAGTPDLPVTGSLGLGMRCENGRCQFIAGQNPFSDPTNRTFTISEAMALLRGSGRGSSSAGQGSFPNLQPPGGLTSPQQLPCPTGQRRNYLGMCVLNLSFPSTPGMRIRPPSASTPGLNLGNLQSSVINQFAQNNATLPASADGVLQPLVSQINALPANTLIHIDGHASTEGTPERNLQISTQRANAVMSRLVTLGVTDASRLLPEGKGSTEPLVSPDPTEAERGQNRRVEVWFFSGQNAFQLRMPGSLMGP